MEKKITYYYEDAVALIEFSSCQVIHDIALRCAAMTAPVCLGPPTMRFIGVLNERLSMCLASCLSIYSDEFIFCGIVFYLF